MVHAVDLGSWSFSAIGGSRDRFDRFALQRNAEHSLAEMALVTSAFICVHLRFTVAFGRRFRHTRGHGKLDFGGHFSLLRRCSFVRAFLLHPFPPPRRRTW